jgi:hypothetical protein
MSEKAVPCPYEVLGKAAGNFIKGYIDYALALWKAIPFYVLNPNIGLWQYASDSWLIETDELMHASVGAYMLTPNSGVYEQLRKATPEPVRSQLETQLTQVEPVKTMLTTIYPTAVKATRSTSEQIVRGVSAIPRGLVYPLPENVRVELASAYPFTLRMILTMPEESKPHTNPSVQEATEKFASTSQTVTKTVESILTASQTGNPAILTGNFPTTPTPPPTIPTTPQPPTTAAFSPITAETAENILRQTAEAGMEVLRGVQETIRNYTAQSPLNPDQASQVKENFIHAARNIAQIRARARMPSEPIPPLEINTIYGPEYVCPICGSVYYTREALRMHLEATGHGRI